MDSSLVGSSGPTHSGKILSGGSRVGWLSSRARDSSSRKLSVDDALVRLVNGSSAACGEGNGKWAFCE